MIFASPVWFLLIIPVLILLYSIRHVSKFSKIFAWIISAVVILAMCNPSLMIPSRKGIVVVLADRSASMPAGVTSKHSEAVELIQSKMDSADRLAVISFGNDAMIDQTPHAGFFGGFVSKVDPNGSDINSAVELAMSVIEKDTPARILILSDGNWTRSDPTLAAGSAAARKIPIDYRLIERKKGNDIAIDSIDVPSAVSSGQAFMITAWIKSPTTQELSYRLSRGANLIGSGKRIVPAGISRLVFRDKAGKPGNFIYKLKITPKQNDIIIENNSARFCVGIEGPKPVLLVSGQPNSKLSQLLTAGEMEIVKKSADKCRWSLEHLAKYSAAVIEEVPAPDIGTSGMENIVGWVNHSGAGLMMTGGENSFGPGGYFKSPLDPILPVSMELRREHRKLSLAIAVVLDRSGSMTAPVGGGKSKMDLANLATAQVVDLLTEMDELACIAVDSSPHIIVPMGNVGNKGFIKSKILRIRSMGGGIFVYEGLKAAVKQLNKAKAMTKHIILFSDAADSEQPGDYRKLLAKCKSAGITCSVIGLGTKSDVDARFLEDIARRGNGRIFFTTDAGNLPRLFAQDTFVVARSSFINEITPIKFTPVMSTLAGKSFSQAPQIGGYNLCYIKPQALLGSLTVDEYKAPVTAAWRSQLGRVLCYTPQADGKHTGPIGKWKSIGDYITSLARWAAGVEDRLGDDMMLTQQINEGICTVKLHLDPDRKKTPFESLPKISVLQGKIGEQPKSKSAALQWDTADSLSIELPMNGDQTVMSTVEVPGRGKVTLPPACLPYSPEFKPHDESRALSTLTQLARMTGGHQRVNLSEIWKDLPRQPQMVSIAKWLYLLAGILILLDVFQRRTGLLSAMKLPSIAISDKLKKSSRKVPILKQVKLKANSKNNLNQNEEIKEQENTQPDKESETPDDDLLNAFKAARSQTKHLR